MELVLWGDLKEDHLKKGHGWIWMHIPPQTTRIWPITNYTSLQLDGSLPYNWFLLKSNITKSHRSFTSFKQSLCRYDFPPSPSTIILIDPPYPTCTSNRSPLNSPHHSSRQLELKSTQFFMNVNSFYYFIDPWHSSQYSDVINKIFQCITSRISQHSDSATLLQ